MFDNFFAELRAVVGVGEGGFERGAGNAKGLGCDTNATAFEIGKRNRQTLAARAEQMTFGNRAVIKKYPAGVRGTDAEFFFRRLDMEAGRIRRHDECGQAFFAEFRIGHRKHNRDMRAFAIGDELFCAVQYPFAIDKLCRGLEIIGFRSGLCLSQTKAADFFARSKIAQVHLFLRIGPPRKYWPTANRIVYAH